MNTMLWAIEHDQCSIPQLLLLQLSCRGADKCSRTPEDPIHQPGWQEAEQGLTWGMLPASLSLTMRDHPQPSQISRATHHAP